MNGMFASALIERRVFSASWDVATWDTEAEPIRGA